MSPDRVPRLLAIDVGGTFTDAVAWDGAHLATGKVSSTPSDQSVAVTAAAADLAPDADLLVHGTTVATNALLERRGATTALITTAGFEDVIEIGRQDRPSLYDSFADRPEPLVDAGHRLGVANDSAVAPPIPDGVEAVAIALLYGFERPDVERAIAADVTHRHPEIRVTTASDVAPEFREYERTSTTVLNAYLQPEAQRYLDQIGRRLAASGMTTRLAVMRSSGGLISPERAGALPAAILLSGPAGGVVAAAELGKALGHASVISFDMGGTSTDVCRIEDGVPQVTYNRAIDGYPNLMPSVAIHTVGAGGGSIAWIDAGGSLRTGPHSAGADPGPAAYRRGGTRPTVTDANVVLGRIGGGLAGGVPIDADAAASAIDEVAGVFRGDRVRTALGVIEVVEEVMAGAIRKVTVEEGADPRRSVLVAFGGAGGLHAGSLARRLGMRAAVIPPHAGVFSALGLLLSPPRVDRVAGVLLTAGDADRLRTLAGEVTAAAQRELTEMTGAAGTGSALVDVRYVGQSHELTIPLADGWDRLVRDFTDAHHARNGFARPGDPIEVVAVRGTAIGPAALDWDDLPRPTVEPTPPLTRRVITAEGSVDAPVVDRTAIGEGDTVEGPAVIVEPEATSYIGGGERATMTATGAIEVTW